jgi:phenylalanine-4-hydroxylase
VPEVEYTEAEHTTWQTVCRELRPLWVRSAVRTFRDAVEAVDLPADHVPQLSEVTARLQPVSNFAYLPVAGLAPLRDFYAAFGQGAFWSTQYLRHQSCPLYTPEPDLCHEVLGHANQLGDPAFADIYRRVASATARITRPEALSFLSKVFWFTIEFGVAREGGELRAYGAGLLSSFGEMQAFRTAATRPIDWVAMGTQSYDITHYQKVLYEAPSMAWLVDNLAAFLDAFDDEQWGRLTATTES